MSMPSSSALVAARPEQPPVAQRLLDLAALLGQVAAAVGRRPARAASGRPRRAAAAAVSGHLLGAAPGADERQRPHALDDQVGQQVGRPPTDAARRTGAPFSPAYDVNGGSHSASATSPRGDVVVGHRHHVEPGQPRGADSGSATVAEASTNVGSAP